MEKDPDGGDGKNNGLEGQGGGGQGGSPGVVDLDTDAGIGGDQASRLREELAEEEKGSGGERSSFEAALGVDLEGYIERWSGVGEPSGTHGGESQEKEENGPQGGAGFPVETEQRDGQYERRNQFDERPEGGDTAGCPGSGTGEQEQGAHRGDGDEDIEAPEDESGQGDEEGGEPAEGLFDVLMEESGVRFRQRKQGGGGGEHEEAVGDQVRVETAGEDTGQQGYQESDRRIRDKEVDIGRAPGDDSGEPLEVEEHVAVGRSRVVPAPAKEMGALDQKPFEQQGTGGESGETQRGGGPQRSPESVTHVSSLGRGGRFGRRRYVVNTGGSGQETVGASGRLCRIFGDARAGLPRSGFGHRRFGGVWNCGCLPLLSLVGADFSGAEERGFRVG